MGWICRRRQAMFHPPTSLGPNTQQFLPFEEAKKILGDLNKILHKTGFNPRPNNPCFCLIALATFATVPLFMIPILYQPINWDETPEEREERTKNKMGVGLKMALSIAPMFGLWIFYFFLLCFFRHSRRSQLTGYVAQWNRSWSEKGVMLSFGGGGTTPRGVTVGSDEGGTYENF